MGKRGGDLFLFELVEMISWEDSPLEIRRKKKKSDSLSLGVTSLKKGGPGLKTLQDKRRGKRGETILQMYSPKSPLFSVGTKVGGGKEASSLSEIGGGKRGEPRAGSDLLGGRPL